MIGKMQKFSDRRRSLAFGVAAAVGTTAFWLNGASPAKLVSRSFPSRPITLVVPSTAGGELDYLARCTASVWEAHIGQRILVEDLGGASGSLAATRVLRSPADGYTLLFGTTSDMVVAPICNEKFHYAAHDFTPILKCGATSMAIVAGPGLGVDTVDEMVALARRHPGMLSIATLGEKSVQSLAATCIARAGSLFWEHIPYGGGPQLLNDLSGGRVDLAIVTMPAALRQFLTGKVRILGVLSRDRDQAAPEIPTVNEGKELKGIDVQLWAGVAGPPAMSESLIKTLNTSLSNVLRDSAYIRARKGMGDTIPRPRSADHFGQFLREEESKFRSLTSSLEVARYRSIFDGGWPLTDRHGIDDPAVDVCLLRVLARAAHAPGAPEMLEQFLLQGPAGLNEEAAVDGLV